MVNDLRKIKAVNCLYITEKGKSENAIPTEMTLIHQKAKVILDFIKQVAVTTCFLY